MNHEIQILLVASTISIALVTLWGVRRSNNLLKEELKLRYRPSLARLHMQITDDDVTKGQHDKKITLRFVNRGSLPAINITKKFYVDIIENGNIIERKTSDSINSNGIPTPSIASHESMGIDIPLSDLANDLAWRSNNVHFGLRLDYQDTNGINYYYVMEGHLEPIGTIMLSKKSDMN